MQGSPKLFLGMILSCLVIQGFFAMVEMASVSFNKVRLQYYVSRSNKRAIWLSYLLHRPALLFGTTLIGVNAALIVGSECARRFYEALGYNPAWAPLTQVVIVLVFAELGPMFAGRRYAEHVALLGAPLLFFCSILLRPFIWVLDVLCRSVNRWIGKPLSSESYLSREELQTILSEQDETLSAQGSSAQLNTIVANIFGLKTKRAKDLMEPLSHLPIVPSFCTVGEMRVLVADKRITFLPIYHRNPQNIVAIAYVRDLLRYSDNKRIKEYARPPWFITEQTSVLHLLKQFRHNNQSLSIVLNDKGVAVGVLTLDDIVDEIFGRANEGPLSELGLSRAQHVVLDKKFPADFPLHQLNASFNVHLSYLDAQTLEEVMTCALGHSPAKGESVRVDGFELTVEEASLLGVKMIQVRTLF